MRGRELSSGRWQRLRELVFARDGDVCHLCGLPGADSVDHIVPRSVNPGLTFDPANLRPAHFGCNSRRGARRMDRVERAAGW